MCLTGSQSFKIKNLDGLRATIILQGEYSKIDSGHSYHMKIEFLAGSCWTNSPFVFNFTLINHDAESSTFTQGDR